MKGPKFRKWILLCLMAVGLLALESAFGAPPDNYTGNMMVNGMVMPMAKMGNDIRVENPMIHGLVTISHMDSRKVVMMSTRSKTYFEQTMIEQAPSIYDPKTVVEKKKIGSETIDGHPCIKYDAVIYLKSKPDDKYRSTIWEAQDLGGLAIRSETVLPEKIKDGQDKVVNELKDIKVGAARPSMFEVPADYKKTNSMMELMGGTGMMEMPREKNK
jgi:hypothetical protein